MKDYIATLESSVFTALALRPEFNNVKAHCVEVFTGKELAVYIYLPTSSNGKGEMPDVLRRDTEALLKEHQLFDQVRSPHQGHIQVEDIDFFIFWLNLEVV